MSAIEVPAKLTERKIEQLLKALHNSEEEVDLHLPDKLEYRGFGIMPQFFLLLFTWIREKSGKIILPFSPTDEASLKDFALDYYGYTVASTVWKHRQIENVQGESLKPSLREFTKIMFEKIDFLDGLPKEAVLIPNFDHYSKVRGLSHWFYANSYDFYDAPSALENTFFRIFQCLSVNRWQRIKAGSQNVYVEIQEILWELFKNTDEHATTDYLDKVILEPSTRCVFFKIHQSSKAKFLSYAKANNGLAKYYKQALNDDINYLLEISVFDSGPGIVKRFLGRNWDQSQDLESDINAIKRCLIKGQSSVQSSKGKSKGYGLDHVLKLLDRQNGFLKIRTGRTSLYRDLITDPYVTTQNIEEVPINDWETDSLTSFTEMPFAAGTMISMVYPINELA